MARIVRDAMVAHPLAVDAATPVADAARALDQHPGPEAVVVQQGRPVGVVTASDLPDGDVDGATPVGEVCPEAAFVLRASDPLAQAIQLMRKRDEAQLPVVQDGALVGVVRLDDLQDELEEGTTGSP